MNHPMPSKHLDYHNIAMCGKYSHHVEICGSCGQALNDHDENCEYKKALESAEWDLILDGEKTEVFFINETFDEREII